MNVVVECEREPPPMAADSGRIAHRTLKRRCKRITVTMVMQEHVVTRLSGRTFLVLDCNVPLRQDPLKYASHKAP